MILAAIKAYNDDLGDFDDHRIEKPKIVHDFSTRLGELLVESSGNIGGQFIRSDECCIVCDMLSFRYLF